MPSANLARASVAMTAPISPTSTGSKDAPHAIGDGKTVLTPAHATPWLASPSQSYAGSDSRGIAGTPLSSHDICSASVMAAMSASRRATRGSDVLNQGQFAEGEGPSSPLSQPGELPWLHPAAFR